MANLAAVSGTPSDTVTQGTHPITTGYLNAPKPVVPPGDSFAGGGPTAGQLFPLGTRLSSP